MRRVVVTGLGVVSPIGIGVDAFWNHLTHGVSGVGRITKFDAAGLPSQIAAEIAGFDPEAYLPRRDVVRTDTFIHFALTASQQALADAKREPSAGDARMGVSIGTSLGGLPLVFKTYDGLLQEQMRGVNPYAMPGFLPNMARLGLHAHRGARTYCVPHHGVRRRRTGHWGSVSPHRTGRRGCNDRWRLGCADQPVCGGVLQRAPSPVGT